MTEVYLSINKETFEETKERAIQENKDISGEEYEDNFLYQNCSLNDESIECNNGSFEIYGDLIDNNSGKSLGYLSVSITPDIDLILNLIEFYMKKLGKLKTILEATK